MRRIYRIVLLTALLAAAPVLSACENFDPDKLDVFNLNEKKKLPGERKPLFPNGVPGVSQGVPPEYLKGNLQEQPGAAIADPVPPPAPAAADQKKTAAVAPAAPAEPAKPMAQEKPKPKAKAKPKTKVAAPRPAQQQQQQQQQQQKTAPWPDQAPPQPGAAAPWPTQQNDAAAPWPASPPPGTFSR
jgi:hypothetical protein